MTSRSDADAHAHVTDVELDPELQSIGDGTETKTGSSHSSKDSEVVSRDGETRVSEWAWRNIAHDADSLNTWEVGADQDISPEHLANAASMSEGANASGMTSKLRHRREPDLVRPMDASDVLLKLRHKLEDFSAARSTFEDELRPREIEVILLTNEEPDSLSPFPQNEAATDVRPTTLVRIADVGWVQSQLDAMQAAMYDFLETAQNLDGLRPAPEPPPSVLGLSSTELLRDLLRPDLSRVEGAPDGVTYEIHPERIIDAIGESINAVDNTSNGYSNITKPASIHEITRKSTQLEKHLARRALLQERLVDLYFRHRDEAVDRNFRTDQDQDMSETEEEFNHRFYKQRKTLSRRLTKLNKKIDMLESKVRETMQAPTDAEVLEQQDDRAAGSVVIKDAQLTDAVPVHETTNNSSVPTKTVVPESTIATVLPAEVVLELSSEPTQPEPSQQRVLSRWPSRNWCPMQ